MPRTAPAALVRFLPVALCLVLAACAGTSGGQRPASATGRGIPADTMLGVGEAPALQTGQLADDIFHIRGTAAGGVLVVVGKEGLLLVDSGAAKEAAALDAAIREVSPLPVKWVINTHYHEDHIGGNARYRKQGATIVAHANMWAQASKDTVIADWNDWRRTPAPKDAKPTMTFTDTMHIDFEGQRVVLLHLTNAHTDGDVIVWLPERNVLHTGDIVEIGSPLFIDFWAGGSVPGVVRALFRMFGVANDSTAVVPGHGDAISGDMLRQYQRTVSYFANLAQESINEGRTFERFMALEPGKEHGAPFGGERGARQVSALMYYGLNGMKK